MTHRYKTIDTRTLAGIRQAERLKRAGWIIVSVGFYRIQFMKAKTR